MSDDQISTILDELSPVEQRVLSRTIRILEGEIRRRLLKRLTIGLGIAVTVITASGLISWNSIINNLETNIVQKITADPALRDNVANKSLEKVSAASNSSLESQKEAASAIDSLNNELRQLSQMLQQVNEEVRDSNRRSRTKK